MTDPQSPPASSGLIIPEAVRAQYPEIVDLIVGSESMNDEERQYWINILPIMTPEQVENLRGILLNEREQLNAIDKKYAKEIAAIGQEQLVRRTDEERRKRREDRHQQERTAEQSEEKNADAILKMIENQ